MDLSKTLTGHADILLNRAKVRAFLSDCLANDHPKINALMSAYDIGIINTIEQYHPVNSLVKGNAISKLVSQYSMIETTAKWSIETWVTAVSASMIAEMQDKRKREKQEKLAPPPAVSDHPMLSGDLPGHNQDQIEFVSKSDLHNYHTNVSLKKVKGKIYIPCGIGNTDNGFYICGVDEVRRCTNPYANAYALVYNFMTRNSKITEGDKPHYLLDVQTTYYLNYQRVFRLAMIVLQLIKNNKVGSGNMLDIVYDGAKDELRYAVEVINNYAALFARLIGIQYSALKINRSANAIKVSLDRPIKGVYVESNSIPCNAREIWFGQKINYRLTKENLHDLEYLLSEISSFGSFKEGQFEALRNMLGSNGHSICIMPTGSGKSLIFYMASLLQPLPLFVVVPTEILIKDQIRNLQKFHHFDNVSHLRLTLDNDFKGFEIHNSLMYLTPATFQNRNLLIKFRYINNGVKLVNMHEERVTDGPQISYIVLDEIHCLSNWGHDFRPEYLMLSKFLNKFLDRATFLGFTATANFTVVEDIQKQLNIPQKNIFSPIAFEKYNVSYIFRSVNSTEEMFTETCAIVEELIQGNERTIIFTKSDVISFRLADRIGYEADVFQSDNTGAYQLFAEEKCKVLVASEDLGIGINFPNIKNIIHLGLPVSKNEYVQEIGRAGRANEFVTSYVVYLKPSPENVPLILLKRKLEIPNISELLNATINDYSDCYRKLNNNIDSKDDLLEKLMGLYTEFITNGKALFVNSYPVSTVETTKKYIYMLYAIGYVDDWYSYSADEKKGTLDVLITINSTNDYYGVNSNIQNRVKERAIKYYDFLGNNREQIVKTQRAKTIEDTISIYVDWYYAKFLYHHKELFLDLLDFMQSNLDSSNEKVTDDIKEYFALPFVEIKSDEAYYSRMSLKDIANKVAQGIGRNTLVNIERINSNRYAYNLDCFILMGTIKLDGRFDENRFERILSNTPHKMVSDLLSALTKIYSFCSTESRFAIMKGLEEHSYHFGLSFLELCERLYFTTEKDVLYYGLVALSANKHF